ncbi:MULTISPECIES: YciI family protein [unclassified Duganella]|uniref:YciI family protein n=1 Tax=unclassified Duganella TaxID=2636909 RepID=UPI000A48BC97|nr:MULTISPECIES: transcription initiation protein [unclassified Duganella]
MAKYLISFPSAAMVVPDGEWDEVVRTSHAVIEEAKAAGVYVFGGGINEGVAPVLVSADGLVEEGGYPWAPSLDGGFTVLELPTREDAVEWAARIAKACRCAQELRVFQFDPAS